MLYSQNKQTDIVLNIQHFFTSIFLYLNNTVWEKKINVQNTVAEYNLAEY